jgi:hypothetical protein
MPPRAIASQVWRTISIARVSPVRWWWRSRNSRFMCGGNFGAPPYPPNRSSYSRASPAAAASSSSAVSGAVCPPTACAPPMASTTAAPWRSTASRCSRHACDTDCSSRTKFGRGKYVPQKNGVPSGAANTVIGHPPCPVIAWVAVM